MGDIDGVAATFRLINIDADPDAGNFTPAQIRQLKGGGRNTVITYLNIGSCETEPGLLEPGAWRARSRAAATAPPRSDRTGDSPTRSG